jgi:MerR family mercuric resistance operon transcriptional regulator
MTSLTIGKVAKQAEVGIETIRFYERECLIDNPPRRASGYRQYPQETVDRVMFIKSAKELGFTLKEIKELLTLRLAPGATCGQVKKRAEVKINDIEIKIRTLQRMKRALKKLTVACSGKGSVSECPILDALDRRKHES